MPKFDARASVTSLVFDRAEQASDAPSIRYVEQGARREMSRRELREIVSDLLVAFDTLGLVKGDALGIDSSNRWEWVALDLAALGRGLVVVPIDAGWSDRRTVRVLAHANVRCVCSENVDRATRMLRLKDDVPGLASVVVIDRGTDPVPPGTVSFADLRQAGAARRALHPNAVEDALASIAPDDVATLIHTGGSTGEPKGVIRTHRNLADRGWALFPWDGSPADPPAGDEVLMNPLSFCHSAGRWWAHLALSYGCTLALPSATETLTLGELQLLAPTHLSAVPRTLLQLQKLLMPHVEASWSKLEGGTVDAAAGAAFATTVSSLVGGRLRRITWGGGPLAASLHAFFETHAGIAVGCGYGGTEAGIVAVQGTARRFGRAGIPHGAEVRIESGEILVRGPGVSPGYFRNPEATARAQAGDGWWRTGDLGRFDDDGNLVVVGRVTAVFNCSEGTNIDPVEIEQLLEADPYIREAILLGNRRPYLSALLVVDHERIRGERGSDASVEEAIRARVERINERLEDYEKIRRFALLGSFLPEVRHVTIANKIRVDRDAVEKTYVDEIARLYS